MQLIFIWGGAASGKLTVAKELARLTSLPLFHNHLVVDALLERLEFGEPEFVRLREQMWMAGFETAASQGRSLIFTFQPESSVSPGFPAEVARIVRRTLSDLARFERGEGPEVPSDDWTSDEEDLYLKSFLENIGLWLQNTQITHNTLNTLLPHQVISSTI